MDLVIMAAGIGSRFGGLKQIEPIDNDGNFIIDYSIFDALRCGFDKVVFIIKKDIYETFRNTIGKRIEKYVKTEYAFQELETGKEITLPQNRTKPLGTGHAIYSAINNISSNFAVINADDYYGYDAISKIANFLKQNKNNNQYALVGYHAENTINNEASVKRGVCFTNNGNLEKIIESSIEQKNGKLIATPLERNIEPFEIENNQMVSMNLFGFTKDFTTHLNSAFENFLQENKSNLETVEFFLPSVVSNLIETGIAQTKVISTSSTWHGITYREDKEKVVAFLNDLRQQGVYPEHLWNK